MTQAPTKDQEATQAKTPQQLHQKAMKRIDMKVIAGLKLLFASSSMCVALIGCGGGSDVAPEPMSAMSQCGLVSNNFGPAFFCGTKQANLNVGGFEDGSTGYCMLAGQSGLSIVGYSATTNNGGAYLVTSQADASTLCGTLSKNPFPYNCTTYIQCNRICAEGVSNCTGR